MPRKFHTMNRAPRICTHTTIVHLVVFLLSPHHNLRPVPSTRRSGTNASTPTAKKLSLVVVYLSEASLHSIIHSNCPSLERLLIVLGIEIGISCLQIKSPHLKSIGICFEGHELSSKMPLHFKGCSLIIVIDLHK